MTQTVPLNALTQDVGVYYGSITHQNTDYNYYWHLLDATEQQRALQLKNNILRMRYVVVHGQLRALLAKTLQRVATSLVIHKTVHGKPYLADYPEFAFNLSHSDNIFIIAFGLDCQLGVDIEVCKPRINMATLVGKCFAQEEADYWQQLPENQQNEAFYRFWTRKEAFVKATGKGIALGLRQCVINPYQPSTFLRIPADCGDASAWYLHNIELFKPDSPLMCSALSVDKKTTAIHLNQLDSKQQ